MLVVWSESMVHACLDRVDQLTTAELLTESWRWRAPALGVHATASLFDGVRVILGAPSDSYLPKTLRRTIRVRGVCLDPIEQTGGNSAPLRDEGRRYER